ncbi:MAG: hypothetical protein IJR49_00590, partial [Treponema sp.]|nr:hypothetical protein [Treponema sp.]
MNLENLDSDENDRVVVTDYIEFRKIVCAYIKRMRPKGTTDTDVEKLIEEGGSESIIRAKFNRNKKDYAEGRYVFYDACAVAG